VFALYNIRKADQLLAQGKLLLRQLDHGDVGSDESTTEIVLEHRHRRQIDEARKGSETRLLRKKTLREAFAGWTFPLRFIDFETSRPTLPFTGGRRPNQELLFQFSHHVMDRDGRVEHRTQCLVAESGVVPNAAVVRALRDALTGDAGTVLHWWDHERSVLKDVRDQLRAGPEPDREQPATFIAELVGGADGRPPRLVDMGRPLVARTAFIAGTGGRSSIKKVLQALLTQSAYLRERYSRPVYGTAAMPSLNFRDWAWWREEGGHVMDPYLLLGQLLRYCELDTLAMVMVYQALGDWVK
jgi:hypothetical protein